MNYSETIEYLFHHLPMFSRMGSAAYKKDLHNTIALCEHLGNPQNSFRSIHIGGTNGKGSVSHMLAGVLSECGYTTGLYTSPHLYDFRERIRIDGIMVDEDFVVRFVEEIQPLIQSIEPSFFEITVAMAFSYFRERTVDVAVIEVGLGGRLDSTNIITPELSVITNIGWDHMSLLGDTLPLIAAEKAGIIKKGVPVVIGEKATATDAVFLQAAASQDAPVHFAEEAYEVTAKQWKEQSLEMEVRSLQKGSMRNYSLDLPGIYQEKNIRTVLTAIDVLRGEGWDLPEEKVAKALAETARKTGLMGRWEWLRREPSVVLEVAHNEAGVQSLLAHLRTMSFNRLHLVIGMVKDKAHDAVLRLLPRDAQYYFTQAHIPRALPGEELAGAAALHHLNGDRYDDVNTALRAAIDHAAADDLIIVCGSIFLVAEVKRELFV